MNTTRHVEMSLFPDIQPDKPVGKILGSVFEGSNADLMAAIAPFYLTGSVMDCTFGEGAWWTRFKPEQFVAHDLHKVDGVDFTNLPEADNTYDTVCFDPPYTLSGGISSSTVHDGKFLDRYGIGEISSTSFYDMIRAGLHESARVSRGFVLVKCMEFASGKFHDMPVTIANWATEAGLVKHDTIVHHTGHGPGGHNIFTPKRARRHHSYLLVFTKRAVS